MAQRDQDVHFLASKEEVERIHQKMDTLGIRSMGAYLKKPLKYDFLLFASRVYATISKLRKKVYE